MDDVVRPLTADDVAAVELLQAEARAALEPVRGGAALLAEQPASSWSDAIGRAWVGLLDDVVRRIPERQQGMIIAVVDACRTGLKAGEITGLSLLILEYARRRRG